MLGGIIMRIRYIWLISKVDDKDSNYIFRNREGDLSVVVFFIVILNRSIFDRYKLSYQPILRYFYIIAIAMFIAYCILQLTQFVVVTKTGLMTGQGTINNGDINQYSVKKQLFGYKLHINYRKKDKNKNVVLILGRKNKEIIEDKFKKINVKFV